MERNGGKSNRTKIFFQSHVHPVCIINFQAFWIARAHTLNTQLGLGLSQKTSHSVMLIEFIKSSVNRPVWIASKTPCPNICIHANLWVDDFPAAYNLELYHWYARHSAMFIEMRKNSSNPRKSFDASLGLGRLCAIRMCTLCCRYWSVCRWQEFRSNFEWY